MSREVSTAVTRMALRWRRMKAIQASRLRAQYTPMRKMGTKKQRLRKGETSRRGTIRGRTEAGSRIFCSSPVGVLVMRLRGFVVTGSRSCSSCSTLLHVSNR